MKKVFVLGGYGNFGKRIVENLLDINTVKVVIVGRSLVKAQALINDLSAKPNSEIKATLSSLVIDIYSDEFKQILVRYKPYLIIHTSGPFQGQSYYIPELCVKHSIHYIDLADDRRFVCDINQLDNLAKAQDVLLVSGASSVPGLSGAVIDHFQQHFSEIEALDIAIAPGNRAERGLATVKAILSYTGHVFKRFKQGQWQDVYGWMDARQIDFGDIIGKRWLANVDVPDSTLFPNRYQVKKDVNFQAGLELSILHLTMVAMAYLVKKI